MTGLKIYKTNLLSYCYEGLLICLLLLASQPSVAQNLVPNGDFETYNACPTYLGDIAYSPNYTDFPTVASWVNPLEFTSSDYFNACATPSEEGVPDNVVGYQQAHSGNGYIGIFAFDGSDDAYNWREYAECKLISPLQQGHKYYLSFYVSNAGNKLNDFYEYIAIEKMGAYFSDAEVYDNTHYCLPLTPQVVNTTGYLADTINWKKIGGLFTAQGGEQWLTLGHFYDPTTPISYTVIDTGESTSGDMISYMYVDDVCLTEIVTASKDTAVCQASFPVMLSDSTPNCTYQWSNGDTTAAISIDTIGTYWVQKSSYCAYAVDTIKVTEGLFAPPQVTSPVYYCQYATAVPLSINDTNSTNWYTTPVGGTPLSGAPVPATNVPGDVTYYVSQVNNLGCETQRAAITVHVYPQPVPPTVTGPAYCQNTTAPSPVATGDNLLWYTMPTGGIGSIDAPVINTSTSGYDTLYVSQTINGCESDRAPLIVTIYPGVSIKFDYTIKRGCTQDTITFTNLSTGATLYNWYFGDGHSDSSTNPTHIYAVQGTYIVQLFGTNVTCNSVFTDTITINHPMKASFIASTDTICQGQNIIFYNTSIGTQPTYFWDFGDGFSSIVQDTTSHVYMLAGIYQVALEETDIVPCYDTAFKTVYVDSISPISFSISDSVLCEGKQIIFTGNYSGIGNTGNKWTFGDGSMMTNDNPIAHAYDTTGVMQVTLTANYRICPDTSLTKTIIIKPYPVLNLGPDTSMCPNNPPMAINDLINAGNAQAHWLWSTGDTTSGILAGTPAIYYATVTINGCSTSDSVWVKNDCYINIPNAFTPNGDGVNDYFFPRQFLSDGLVAFKMEIYNRWGKMIFTTTNTNGRGWDGRFNGILQPEGVFVYIVDVTFENGQAEHHQGTVTLLK